MLKNIAFIFCILGTWNHSSAQYLSTSGGTLTGPLSVSNNQVQVTNGSVTNELSFSDGGFGIVGTSSNNGLRLRTNATDRYAIDAAGNHDFKSGTAIFGGTLTVTNNQMQVTNGSIVNELSFSSASGGFGILGTFSNHGIRFRTNASDRYSIDAAGNHNFMSGTASFGGALIGTSSTFIGNANNIYTLAVTNDASGTVYSGTGRRVALFRAAANAVSDQPGIDLGYDDSGTGIIAGSTQGAGTPIAFWTYDGAWAERVRIDKAGNMGIGTINPGSFRLAVKGKIRAEELKVETGWSDFVFEPHYRLRSLKETERFINQNGHLPEIPSAKEVAENGINVGEMNAKLLQKIEELTLHLIEKDKQVSVLQDQMKDQQRQINQLKSKR